MKSKQKTNTKIHLKTSSSSSSMSTSSSKQTHNVEKQTNQSIIPTGNSNKNNLEMKYISKWNVTSTIKWLTYIGYEDCVVHFKEHRINGRALLMLSEDDLKEIIKHNVGQRKNLYHLIRLLQIKYNRYMNKINSSSFFSNDSDNETDCDEDDKNSQKTEQQAKQDQNENDDLISYETDGTNGQNPSIHNHLINETQNDEEYSKDHFNHLNKSSPKSISNYLKKNQRSGDMQNELHDNNMLNFCENCLKKFDDSPYSNYSANNGQNAIIRSYKGEKRKTLVSMIYLFLTCLWTSFMLTVVHDRVPDMQRYPPLPDIILDNVPLIPWAFFATEIIGLVLAFICLLIIIFHKYRFIIFRRMCSLAGTIFFLRSITMLITSLSVPGIHIQCSSQKYGSFINKLHGAWNILSGVGLYVHGVRTCGDYMFSGHTVWLTLLTHFITEYTPNSLGFLHTFSWILNIFGLFFILGAHEHYSIDVFVAFYITSRLFLYYHSLANNKVLFQRDHKRVKTWFPMLSYFESNIHSMVPNQYEFPPNFVTYFYKLIRNKCRQLKRFIGNSGNSNGNSNKNKVN